MPVISKQVDIEIKIDREHVLRNLGYCADCIPPARTVSLVNDYAENVYHFVEPAYARVIRDIVSVDRSRVVLEGSITFESRVIARLLERCEKVAVFALTIGDRLEKMVCHLAEDKRVLQAAVLDMVASDAVEKVADFLQERIGAVAALDGLVTSRRYSPGYCDWKLGQQEMVFRAMNGESAGVRLTEGCLMLPRKSVSGIIGLGYPGEGVEDYNPCVTCRRKDCPGRR